MRNIPTGIWALGFVSLFMDTSSELIHALLPVYLVTNLGASTLTVGIIEGIAESTASITKIFSGFLSDRLGKRKLLVALGYGMAAFTKPVFPLATSIAALTTARFIDRIGKGIRGAPRDALIADIAPPNLRGASFGLRQSLDTVGAFLGPSLAILIMWTTHNHYKTAFWIAVIPAFLSFALILIAVHEPPHKPDPQPSVHVRQILQIGRQFWSTAAIATIYSLARWSEAFLILRAQSLGLSVTLVPAVLIVMNIVYSLAAYPAGLLSDKWNRHTVLATGFALLIAASTTLALAATIATVIAGVILYGLHMAFTQGQLAAMIADIAPTHLRGTAYGVFHFLTGLGLLAANLIAGTLWDTSGPQATFLAAAVLTTLALAGTPFIPPSPNADPAKPPLHG